MKPVIYVLSGVPGSGKSTIGAKIATVTDAVVISTDNIRAELNGSAGNQANGAAVFAIAYERLDKTVADGRNVIWDSTNLDSESRGFVLSHIPSSYGKVAVFTDVSVETCKARNWSRYESELAKRDGDPRLVPEEVINRMMSKYHHPTVAEGFDTIYRVDENGGCVRICVPYGKRAVTSTIRRS